MSSMTAGLWNAYVRASINRPFATKAATCAIGFAIGDGVAQLSTGKGPLRRRLRSLDVNRTLRTSAYGLFVAAPQLHVFFSWLDKVVLPGKPTSPAAIVAKVAADQLFNSPLGTCLFFTWNNLCLGTTDNIWPDIRDKLWPTTKMGWTLWPAAQAVNFMFVPSHLRVAYINVIAIVWTTILSRMAAQKPTDNIDLSFQEQKLSAHRV